MHPVGKRDRNPNRMSGYEEHVDKYDFPSPRFPVSQSSIGSFATKNDLLLYECGGGVQHYNAINNFSRLVCNQFSNHQ